MNRATQVILAFTFAVGICVGWFGKPTKVEYINPAEQVEVMCVYEDDVSDTLFCVRKDREVRTVRWPRKREIL